jgi:hypothetical protein
MRLTRCRFSIPVNGRLSGLSRLFGIPRFPEGIELLWRLTRSHGQYRSPAFGISLTHDMPPACQYGIHHKSTLRASDARLFPSCVNIKITNREVEILLTNIRHFFTLHSTYRLNYLPSRYPDRFCGVDNDLTSRLSRRTLRILASIAATHIAALTPLVVAAQIAATFRADDANVSHLPSFRKWSAITRK